MTEKMARLGALLAPAFAFRTGGGGIAHAATEEFGGPDGIGVREVEHIEDTPEEIIVVDVESSGNSAIGLTRIDGEATSLLFEMSQGLERQEGPYLYDDQIEDDAGDALTSAKANGDDLPAQADLEIIEDEVPVLDPVPEGLEAGAMGFLVFHELAASPEAPSGLVPGIGEDGDLIF